jgi:hypothetical protein
VAGPLRRFRRPSAGVLAGAWFIGLALVVAGPLLGRGYLILLDFPTGPDPPEVSLFPLPSSGDLGNALPLNAAHRLLHDLWAPLPGKVFLVVPIVLAGLGVYRLVRDALGVGAVAAVFGGTLYVVNPFVYDRYLAGHLHFALGYALLPWAVGPLGRVLKAPSHRAAAVVGLWLAVLAAVSFHVAGLYALLIVLVAIVAIGRARARAAFAAVALGLGALVSAYWLVPVFFAPERRVGVADLGPYETRPDGFAVVPTLLALYGFWREEFARPAQERPVLYLLLLPILGLVVVGGVMLLRRAGERRLGLALVVAGAVGVLLGAGTAFPPTAEVFRWLFEHVPFVGAFREPQKFLALTVLAYAVFGAAGLAWLTRSRRWVVVAAPIAVGSVLLYGYAMLWGLSGQIELSHYPDSWSQADRLMKRRGEGSLLVLPWKLYEDWTFTDARIVANPTLTFFSEREVLSANDAGFATVPPESVDSFFYYVTDLLNQEDIRGFGRQVAPLGVRFVAWTEEAEPEAYQMLSGQNDLTEIFFSESGDLTVFENRAWEGDVTGLRQIRARPTVVEPARGRSFALARRFPGWDEIPAPATPALAVAKRCSDGWRLGERESRCHLGAVAAYESPPTTTELWRTFAGIQVVGYAITLVGLALTALVWHRGGNDEGRASARPSMTDSSPETTT